MFLRSLPNENGHPDIQVAVRLMLYVAVPD